MKTGRPRDEYPQGEFRGVVLKELTRRRLSLRVLELLCGVNRGTLSAVLNGRRPCERRDREAILGALGLATESHPNFLPAKAGFANADDRVLLDGQFASSHALKNGQRLMSHAQFSDAHAQFRQVFEYAAANGKTALQAEAAGYLGWFHGELEQFEDARRWLLESIRLIETELGMNTDEIVETVGGSASVTAMSAELAQTLGRALRIYGKVLIVRVIHDLDYGLMAEIKRRSQQSIRLDERLRLPELAHNLRWQAVAVSAQDGSKLQQADALLSSSREMLGAGTAGEASLIREQGIVRWQKHRLPGAWDLLWEAKERLTHFADARALGPTFCALSKVAVQGHGNPVQARRQSLIAAALHPFGYVLNHCGDQLRTATGAERQHDFEALLTGAKPFTVVHQVLADVAGGSPFSGMDLLQRNLARVQQGLRSPARIAAFKPTQKT